MAMQKYYIDDELNALACKVNDEPFNSEKYKLMLVRHARLRLTYHLSPPSGFFNASPSPARLRLRCREAKILLRFIPLFIARLRSLLTLASFASQC